MKTIKKVSESYVGDTPIATSITSSSTNDEVAGAKAVYDFLQVEDITSQVSYTVQSGVTVTNFNALKTGSIIFLSVRCTYSHVSPSVKQLLTLNNFLPAYAIYAVGSQYAYDSGGRSSTLRLTTNGTLSVLGLEYSHEQVEGSFMYITTENSSSTNSLNATRLMNTGSLVGMGDRAEVTNETLEKTKLDEVTDKDVGEQEVKEVTPLETTEEKTEGSGDTIKSPQK